MLSQAVLVAVLACIAEANPYRRALEVRGPGCNGDNLLNRFRDMRYASQAKDFCATFITEGEYLTATITTATESIPTEAPLTSTHYPSPLLTSSYPVTRLSSACSCITYPHVTRTRTVYEAAETTSTVSDSSTTDSSSTSTSTSTSDASETSTSTSISATADSNTTTDATLTSSDAASSTTTDPITTATTEPMTTDPVTTTTTDPITTTTTEPTTTTDSSTPSTEASTTSDSASSSTSTDGVTTTATGDATTTSTQPPAAPTTDSLSCWYEGTTGRALPVQHFSNDMTVEMCASLCETYTYYGVEYGSECYCGNSISNGAFPVGPVDVDQCNIPCAGDPAQMCGGMSKLNIYRVSTGPSTTGPSGPSPTASTYPYQSAGCFQEPEDGSKALTQVYASTKMTKELCFYNCFNGGYEHAGLEYGSECWCGHQVAPGTLQLGDSSCSMPCSGDATQTCGAGNVIQLYSSIV